MKTFRYFLAVFLIPCSLAIANAQIHVDANEDVGIGTNNTDNSKLKIINSTNTKGFYLHQNYNSASTTYGIHNYIEAVGTGQKFGVYNDVRQNSSASNQTTGFYNQIYPYGTGSGYGIQNFLRNAGTGTKYGFYGNYYQNASSSNALYGTFNYLRNYGSNSTYGFFNYIYPYGTGAKEGIYNSVNQAASTSSFLRGNYTALNNQGTGTSTAYEAYINSNGTGSKRGLYCSVSENASSQGSSYGIYNQSYLYGLVTGYGIYNRVYDNANSNGTKYGIYNYVQDLSTNNTIKYGIYNYLEKQGTGTNYALWSGVAGGTDYAGYFSGNVVVTGTVIDGVSDARLKEEVKKLDGAMSMIAKLQPKSYVYKQDMGIALPQGRQYGLIAQELEKIAPEMVIEFKHPGKPIYKTVNHSDEVVMVPVDTEGDESLEKLEEGQSIPMPEMKVQKSETEPTQEIVGFEEEQSFKAIDYKALIPVLVGAVQEQQLQIEQLKEDVKTLQAEVNRLSKK